MNLNKVILIGRLTRDPEKKIIPTSGKAVVNVSLATSMTYTKDGEKIENTEFHNIVAFDRLAEVITEFLQKGSLVMFEGRLQTRSWDSKEDGSKRYRTEIIVEKMQMGPKSTNSSSYDNSKSSSRNDTSSSHSSDREIPIIDEDDIDVRDIPF